MSTFSASTLVVQLSDEKFSSLDLAGQRTIGYTVYELDQIRPISE